MSEAPGREQKEGMRGGTGAELGHEKSVGGDYGYLWISPMLLCGGFLCLWRRTFALSTINNDRIHLVGGEVVEHNFGWNSHEGTESNFSVDKVAFLGHDFWVRRDG